MNKIFERLELPIGQIVFMVCAVLFLPAAVLHPISTIPEQLMVELVESSLILHERDEVQSLCHGKCAVGAFFSQICQNL